MINNVPSLFLFFIPFPSSQKRKMMSKWITMMAFHRIGIWIENWERNLRGKWDEKYDESRITWRKWCIFKMSREGEKHSAFETLLPLLFRLILPPISLLLLLLSLSYDQEVKLSLFYLLLHLWERKERMEIESAHFCIVITRYFNTRKKTLRKSDPSAQRRDSLVWGWSCCKAWWGKLCSRNNN